MSSGYLGYASDAPSTRQFDYFSTQDIWPPYISPVTISPTELWPPNHQIVDVTLSYEAADDCSDVTTELTVTSDEPETGAFTGDTGPDWEIVDDHHVRLRAERAGSGDGRIYTIRVTASDEAGNTSWQTKSVTVPHN
jgi:hypothetical protein